MAHPLLVLIYRESITVNFQRAKRNALPWDYLPHQTLQLSEAGMFQMVRRQFGRFGVNADNILSRTTRAEVIVLYAGQRG
jgi:cytochrome c oxidase assembly protein Cox11